MNVSVRDVTADRAAKANRRARFMRQLRQWHWISGAISLISMLLFAITGITLNHSSAFESKAATTTAEGTLSQSALSGLTGEPKSGRAVVSAPLADAVSATIGIDIAGREAEWTDGEAYVSLPRPGGDAWVSIERDTGKVTYEKTDRGWISYLNDLHKGRHTGQAVASGHQRIVRPRQRRMPCTPPRARQPHLAPDESIMVLPARQDESAPALRRRHPSKCFRRSPVRRPERRRSLEPTSTSRSKSLARRA